jgi:hypothetical protein
VSSAIIDKYIGESARLIREMFNYAREHQVSFVLFCFVLLSVYVYLAILTHLFILGKVST